VARSPRGEVAGAEAQGARAARLAAITPALVAAVTFGSVSVAAKVAFVAGADVATFLAFRGALGAALLWLWLRARPAIRRFTRRELGVALLVGVLSAANVYTIFRAIEIIPVPVAVLTYFIYPLLTGLAAPLAGLERLSARGLVAALVAFGGLALMIGAHAGELAAAGIVLAAVSGAFRAAMLLVTRIELPAVDSRATTFYSTVASTPLFVAMMLVAGAVHLPAGAAGWSAFLWASVGGIVALLATFVSAVRIGPFRTALVMNLEPVAAALLSVLVLGETLSGVQAVGAAIMIGALVWFQARR
jgi:drug/metabolite transporter (DMT)-like permease